MFISESLKRIWYQFSFYHEAVANHKGLRPVVVFYSELHLLTFYHHIQICYLPPNAMLAAMDRKIKFKKQSLKPVTRFHSLNTGSYYWPWLASWKASPLEQHLTSATSEEGNSVQSPVKIKTSIAKSCILAWYQLLWSDCVTGNRYHTDRRQSIQTGEFDKYYLILNMKFEDEFF